ncbi:uncharacterized protein LOC113459222 [Zonotrichia albicollis]|uniref:uncharacterized protein LOC113459222 n=1 Tax=Zonotrichia albicollis TaxID=44394 RepID=UPI000EAB05D6|nr:uncharacterized protein LOC113459222 [Zonotrichia albicollis]
MGQEIIKASDESNRPPSSKSGSIPLHSRNSSAGDDTGLGQDAAGMRPRCHAERQERSPACCFLPLCDQLSYRCNSQRRRAATSRRQEKRIPWALYANGSGCVCALHGGNWDALFVCISEHPPCGSAHTCRETRTRFHLERYPTFRNRVWDDCPRFGSRKAKGRQMLRRDADLLGVPAQGRDRRRSHQLGHLPGHSCHGILRRVSHQVP